MQMSITLMGLVGPIIGTVFYEYLAPDEPNNFRYSCDAQMLQMIVFAFIYFVFNCGCDVMKKERIIKEEKEKRDKIGEKMMKFEEVE